MERISMLEEQKNRARRRVSDKLCGLLIAAMLLGGLSTGMNVSTYTVEAAEPGREHGIAAPAASGKASAAATTEKGTSGEEMAEEDADPTTVPEPDLKPSPEPTSTEDGQEAEPTPTAELGKEDATLTPEPTSTEDEQETEPTPTLTQQPEKDKATPTPELTGDVEEAEPTPTQQPKKDKVTPTPEPTEGAEVTEPAPTEDLEQEEVTPTPKPTKTPSWAVPTESDDARYQYLLGIDARVITMDNPPEGYKSAAEAAKNMQTITIPIWKMTASGKRYTTSAKLTVNKKLVKNVQAIFKEIYELDIKFPIKVVQGYMYRKVGAVGLSRSTIMSIHSFGAAIDINPGDYDNDYFLGKGNDLRDKSNPYCIPDEVIEIFEKYGWFWGGNFEICADTMHFQYFELGMLTYQNNSPFRTLKVKSGYMTGIDVRSLQQRLCELGFTVSVDGVYGNKTASAVMKYQKSRGLEATGEVNYKTWETIINETHYMPYVF